MNKDYRPKGWTKEHEKLYQQLKKRSNLDESLYRSEIPSVDRLLKKYPINYYDKQGNKIDSAMFSALADDSYKKIQQTLLKNYFISTIWLGLDYGWRMMPEDGSLYRPIIFETMVFPINDKKIEYSDGRMERYSTQEEALTGHNAMVEKYKQFEKTMQNKVPRYEGYNK